MSAFGGKADIEQPSEKKGEGKRSGGSEVGRGEGGRWESVEGLVVGVGLE